MVLATHLAPLACHRLSAVQGSTYTNVAGDTANRCANART